ncbi:hypothetical protein E2562_023048, partial [Oryza meyeriana var. granulata]
RHRANAPSPCDRGEAGSGHYLGPAWAVASPPRYSAPAIASSLGMEQPLEPACPISLVSSRCHSFNLATPTAPSRRIASSATAPCCHCAVDQPTREGHVMP